MLRKSYFLYPLALFLFLFLFSSGTLAIAETSSKSKSNNKANILMLLPLSGPYSFLGSDGRQGAEIAMSEIEQPLKANIIYADSRGDPVTAISEFNRSLVLDRIIASYALRGPIGMAINSISKAKSLPLLGGVANKNLTLENPYAFQLWADSEAEGSFLTQSFRRIGAKTIALITAEDDYTKSVSIEVLKSAKNEGLDIQLVQDVSPSELDFRSIALSLSKLKPDIIFINVSVSQIGPVVKQLKQMNIQSKLISNFWLAKKEVLSPLGDSANGLFFIEMSTDYPVLSNSLNQRYGSSPSGATISAYVATHMLAKATKLIAVENFSAKDLFDSLSQLTQIETKNGIFAVNQRKVKFPLSLKTIENLQIKDY